MAQTDPSNTIFKLAADLVNNTSRHIFLTGKAGTGKTTFLKYIKENSRKQAVVVAPTGVAAINAGGVTMHSFFQLPFGPYIPGTQRGFTGGNDEVADKHSLFKNIRFNADKRDLLQELELLIIDEVSMVRADMLDAIDIILRHFRKKMQLPFGGVQVLYIGDMYQLPPVVSNNEWEILNPYYESPFFFDAQVIKEAAPLYIELKKIYRQNEQAFIDVLNRVRNNQLGAEDYNLLNNRYQPAFIPAKEDKYITLTTHNRTADAINATALDRLPGQTTVFTGVIEGDFSDKALPTEMKLLLKEGAQVMFIKNDSSGERKFFNGKLATITKISNEEIIATSNDDQQELKIEKETWRNVRYTYDKEKDRIEEEELGSFTQYPLRLAWAVTIHKSQGLTFDKAIIDAGGSFAPGQVYVALSRCTSLQGMVLLSRLQPGAIATDKRVVAFAQKETAADQLQEILKHEQKDYLATELIKTFDYRKILSAVTDFKELVVGKKLPNAQNAIDLSNTLLTKAREQAAFAEKFKLQLQQLLQHVSTTGNTQQLEDRVSKAIDYFVKTAGEELLLPLDKHLLSLQGVTRVRKYLLEANAIHGLLVQQLQKMIKASYADISLCKTRDAYQHYFTAKPTAVIEASSGKPIKGSSQAESFHLFKTGKTIQEIAAIRQLTESTIVGHLATFVRSGELGVLELLTQKRLDQMLPVIIEVGGNNLSPIKDILGDDFTYTDVRIALNHYQWMQEKKVNA
ncbi:MAG: helix-turn-helix domain-containing protein [Chitinophagaceae bacterium]